MKKIMFNDRYGLTEAVLSGRKTQTRRIIKFSPIDANYVNDEGWSIGGYVASAIINHYSRYNVGEVVAVAQAYRDIAHPNDGFLDERYEVKDEFAAGWTNKMFVRADLMPHHIRITNVRVERLQDISDEDCIKEGCVAREHIIPTPAPQIITQYYPCQYMIDCVDKAGWGRCYDSPREAYADLIDKASGRGTWQSNPYVFVYDFELVD